jgi:hypothetical protein
MSATDQLHKLAERFARKIALAQMMAGEDPKATTVDAFFGPHEETAFQQFILKPSSNFSKALPESIKTVDIGASVNAKNKSANFLISTNPVAPQLKATLIHALNEDYKNKYGKYPVERFVERLTRNEIRPNNINQSANTIIHIS